MISLKKADAVLAKLHDMVVSVYLHLPDKALSQFEDIAHEARTSLHPPAPPAAPQRLSRSQRRWEDWEEDWDDALEVIAQEAVDAAQEIQNLIDDDEAYDEDVVGAYGEIVGGDVTDEAVSTIEMGLGNVEEAIEELSKTVEARP